MTHVPALPVRQGLLYLSIAAVAWGTGGAAGALLHRTGHLSPAAVSFWRFACAAALLLAATRLSRGPAGRPRLRTILALGPVMAVCQAAYFAAVAESGVAVATMITMGVNPVLVAIGGRILFREPLGRTALTCLALAVTGVVVLAGAAGGGAAGATAAGVAYALLSSIGYTGTTLLTRALTRDGLTGDGVALWGFTAGAVCLLPLAAAEGLLPAAGEAGVSALLIAYLAAVPTALAYGLFFAGLRVVGGTTAAVIALLEPLVAALLGVVLLGERVSTAQSCGAVALVLAIICLARAKINDNDPE